MSLTFNTVLVDLQTYNSFFLAFVSMTKLLDLFFRQDTVINTYVIYFSSKVTVLKSTKTN